MERRKSPLFGVFSKNPLQLQLFSHQAQYKVHQMPRWYPIQHRWRHQLILFWNPISKCLRHAPIQFLSTVKYGPHYLDRLHEGEISGWTSSEYGGEFEIGRILHLKSENRNLKLDLRDLFSPSVEPVQIIRNRFVDRLRTVDSR